MVGSKYFKWLIIPILPIFLMSQNTFAERKMNLTPSSLLYSLTYNGATTQLGTNGGRFTAWIRNSTTGSQYYFLRRINFNRNLDLAEGETLHIPLTIRTLTYAGLLTTAESIDTVQWHCPTAEYTNIYVAGCDLIDSNIVNVPVSTENINNETGNLAVEGSLLSEYLLDIKIKVREGSNTNNYVNFVDTPILTYNNFDLYSQSRYNYAYIQFAFSQPVYIATDDSTYEEIKKQNDKEEEAEQNISSQDSSDIGGSENAATTSIIGVIGSFVSALQNMSPSSNCNLNLPFPEFIGGSQNVNICQGKDKAPALIQAASSLLLITTFVPLAFILLRMIYSEIRSFTSG